MLHTKYVRFRPHDFKLEGFFSYIILYKRMTPSPRWGVAKYHPGV